jgi:hypothetical protein
MNNLMNKDQFIFNQNGLPYDEPNAPGLGTLLYPVLYIGPPVNIGCEPGIIKSKSWVTKSKG